MNIKILVYKVRVTSCLFSQTYNKLIVRHKPGIWHELSRDRGQTVNFEGSRQQAKLHITKICQYFPEPVFILSGEDEEQIYS